MEPFPPAQQPRGWLPVPPQLPPDPWQAPHPEAQHGQKQVPDWQAAMAAMQAWNANAEEIRRRRRQTLADQLMQPQRPGENPLAAGYRQLGAALGEALVAGGGALFGGTTQP